MPATRVKVNTTDALVSLSDVGAAGSHRSLARDSNGRIWACYRGTETTRQVYAAYSDDGGLTWTEELVSPAATQGFPGVQVIMVDSTDVPHVIWHLNTGVETVRYSTRSGGTWAAFETVFTSGGTLAEMAACIDSGNTFHVVFSEAATMKYVSGTAGAWAASENVDTDAADEKDIVVGTTGIVYTVFYGTLVIAYRQRSAGVWQSRETVSSNIPAAVPTGLSIALDASADLHVAWPGVGTGDQDIRYRKRTGGVWGTEMVVKTHPTSGNNMGPPIMVLDDAGDPWIIYQQAAGSDEGIYYRKIEGGALQAETLVDAAILRPGNLPSCYAGLWQRYPSASILPAGVQPVILINDEVSDTVGRLFFYGGISQRRGHVWIEGTDLRYFDANSIERGAGMAQREF